jgi:hypothetical protein
MAGWMMTSSRFYDELKKAMVPYQGKRLTTAEINNILKTCAFAYFNILL